MIRNLFAHSLWAARHLILLCIQYLYVAMALLYHLGARTKLLLFPLRLVSLSKPPAHLGIVLGDNEVTCEADVLRLAHIVCWCIDAGVQRLTLCDMHGKLTAAPRSLCHALQTIKADAAVAEAKSERVSSPEAPLAIIIHDTSCGWSLKLISLQTGRDDIVGAAQKLCRKVSPRLECIVTMFEPETVRRVSL